jgi:hypothetical protein
VPRVRTSAVAVMDEYWVVLYHAEKDQQFSVRRLAMSSTEAIRLAEESNPEWKATAAGLLRKGEV